MGDRDRGPGREGGKDQSEVEIWKVDTRIR
jgi:hypothetical protein